MSDEGHARRRTRPRACRASRRWSPAVSIGQRRRCRSLSRAVTVFAVVPGRAVERVAGGVRGQARSGAATATRRRLVSSMLRLRRPGPRRSSPPPPARSSGSLARNSLISLSSWSARASTARGAGLGGVAGASSSAPARPGKASAKTAATNASLFILGSPRYMTQLRSHPCLSFELGTTDRLKKPTVRRSTRPASRPCQTRCRSRGWC